MDNVKIVGTGVYIPKNKVYNDEINEHFSQRGLDASHLMRHMGRRKRYFISEDEDAISMCQNAIDDCVEKNHIDLSEIEMLVFCSDTPEFLSPSNAIKLVGLYGEKMKNVNTAFDMNCNCVGVVLGMDVVSKYMKGSGISHALVIGCFCISPVALWGDTVVYANFADAAACVALERADEEEKRGFLDTKMYVDASSHEYVTYPKCGMSKVPLKKIEPNEKRLEWIPSPADDMVNDIVREVRCVLDRNSLTVDDIDHFIFSQLSDADNIETMKLLNVQGENKYHYVGSEYGYTGNTCTILCLNRMWDMYARPGKKILIATIGAGSSVIVQLYQF